MAEPAPGTLAKLKELEGSAAAPLAVAWIRRALTEGRDLDLYKVNPFRVADEAGVPRREALRAFLFGTRLGLFDLNWDVHCPSCTGVPAYHRHLMDLASKAHCAFCQRDWDLDFADQVEVTFTVNPGVRRIEYVDFAERDFDGKMQWFQDIRGRDGRYWEVAVCVMPGESGTYRATYVPGEYEFWLPSHLEHRGRLHVAGEPAAGEQALVLTALEDGSFDRPELRVRPGTVALTLSSRFPQPDGFLLGKAGLPANWVSAAYVTTQQDFRDLYADEFLAPDCSFALRSVTLLFTDIKGSTAMYEALGDAAAYARVQEHFRLMTSIIGRHEGALVKTIGDAVMASFPSSVGAVRAAWEVQAAFAEARGCLEGLQVKIGVHRGPTIAVTSNRCLDFFGRTVNVAARVQGESRAGEVLVTTAVLEDPGVREYLVDRGLSTASRRAEFKGVEGPVEVHALCRRA